MIEHRAHMICRYGETDSMGYAHHSVYALYLEQARMELLLANGLDVLALEKEGIIMPVSSMKLYFHKPLRFGDRINVRVRLKGPLTPSLDFNYLIYKGKMQLVAKAETSLVLARKETGQPILDPGTYLAVLEKNLKPPHN